MHSSRSHSYWVPGAALRRSGRSCRFYGVKHPGAGVEPLDLCLQAMRRELDEAFFEHLRWEVEQQVAAKNEKVLAILELVIQRACVEAEAGHPEVELLAARTLAPTLTLILTPTLSPTLALSPSPSPNPNPNPSPIPILILTQPGRAARRAAADAQPRGAAGDVPAQAGAGRGGGAPAVRRERAGDAAAP